MKCTLPTYLNLLLLLLIPVLSQAQVEEPRDIRYCKHGIVDHDHLREHSTNATANLRASNGRSDTFDIVHTNIQLEVIDFTGRKIKGFCEVDFSPIEEDITVFTLDLDSLVVDSVLFNGMPTTFEYDTKTFLNIDLPQAVSTSDTASVRVYYGGTPTPDPGTFGGFRFTDGIAYNLGIGLSSSPYNFGRSWYPCFDNFVERSTYEFHLITANNRKGYAIGTFLGEMPMGGDTIMRSFEMTQPVPSYLVGVAISEYEENTVIYESISGDVPLQLVGRINTLNTMINTFTDLGAAVDALESWYGPYPWEKVGFVLTPVGAMEHPTLIAYPENVGLGSNNDGHRRLMAHELAHCWWGDIVTLSTPADMWFKEGNAEYGSHLFIEYLQGYDAFIRRVKSNWNLVMYSAHVDDGAYLPLSGLPFENTYGTHTYNKGASMIHNLRAYLGDDLFSSSMTDILDHFQYQSINAAQFRDRLSETSGIDLTSFFDDFIYSPGFAGFEINEMDITPNVSSPVIIEQKLRKKSNLHTNTPIEITFLAADGSRHTEQVMASDHLTEVEVTVPFDPVAAWLNGNHKLNLASFGSEYTFTETEAEAFDFTNITVNVTELDGGDAFIRVEHALIAPDQPLNPPQGSRISNSHYWKIDGLLPSTFNATANFEYQGGSGLKLDADLTEFTEDSIVLVYRPNPSEDWVRYEPILTSNTSPNDGQGIIQAKNLQLGEYTFANGEFPLMVNNKEPEVLSQLEVFPNPGKGIFYLSGQLAAPRALNCSVFDVKGQLIKVIDLGDFHGEWNAEVDLRSLTKGSYLLKIEDEAGDLMASEKVLIQ